MRTTICTLMTVALLAMSTGAPAQVLTEDFSFSGLLSANGWSAHSGVGTQSIDTTTGLTYAGYAGSGIGNAAAVDNNGEDCNRTFGPAITSGDVYCSFMLNVTATGGGGYFLHMGTGAPFNTSTFFARVFTATDGTGDYELGLSTSTSTIQGTTNLDLAFGTTYLVVTRYTFNGGANDDQSRMYVFTSGVPGTEPGAATIGPFTNSGTDATEIGGIALRQFNAAQNMTVDGIRMGTSWSGTGLPVELSSFGLE